MRRAFARNSLGCVVIVLLIAMLPSLAGCESSADEPDMIALLCGTWEGTYTPTAAWDENGPVEDLPFELGMPLEMQLSLYPDPATELGTSDSAPTVLASIFIEETAVPTALHACAADDIGTLYGYEQVGFNEFSLQIEYSETKTALDLSLKGDTLMGEDGGNHYVPSGYISTSGIISLTRTEKWDPSIATATTGEALVPVPKVVGMDVESAGGVLDDCGVDYVVIETGLYPAPSGDIAVLVQNPEPGECVPPGSVVELFVGEVAEPPTTTTTERPTTATTKASAGGPGPTIPPFPTLPTLLPPLPPPVS